jgi:hypothetical protein
VLTADQVVILEYPSNPINKTDFFCYQALFGKDDQGLIPVGAVEAEVSSFQYTFLLKASWHHSEPFLFF